MIAVGSKNTSRPSLYMKAFAYALPQCGVALMTVPVYSVLAGIYAKHFGVALTTIATVMLAARIFDAITDPLVGWLSDRDRVRTGSRKRFIAIGGAGLMPSLYFLLVPPDGVTTFYFTFWYFVFYLTLTIFVIPYLAWANEFTRSGQDKTLVFSFVTVVGSVGGMMFYGLPLLPLFASTEITPEVLRASALLGALLFVPGLIWALKAVPDSSDVHTVTVDAPYEKADFHFVGQAILLVREMMNNQPFLLFIGAFMSLGIGAGMWAGMFFIFVDVYLDQGAAFAVISLWGLVVGALVVPVWYKMSLWLGKRRSWLLGMGMLVLVYFCTGLLSPVNTGTISLFALNMLMSFASASLGVVALPMLCDVIDYGRLKVPAERNAAYFSLQALMTKIQGALGGALGMVLAGWLGFDVATPHAGGLPRIGLLISVSWAPVAFVLLAMFFVAKMPLDDRRMKIIRKRLDQRAARLRVSYSTSFEIKA